MWDTKSQSWLSYKHAVHRVWVITVGLTIYFPCCQNYRANTNNLEVSYMLFLVYYSRLWITWGLILYSGLVSVLTVAWHMAMCWSIRPFKSRIYHSVEVWIRGLRKDKETACVILTQVGRFEQSSVGMEFCDIHGSLYCWNSLMVLEKKLKILANMSMKIIISQEKKRCLES